MENTRQRFDELFSKIERPGASSLLAYLENNGFFAAPCSSQHHGACEGGLLDHSISVTEIALKLRESLGCDVPETSVIVAGLFHDCGKAGFYGKQNYVENRLKGGKISESKPYASNGDRLPMPHQTVSAIVVTKFMALTEQEVYAILYHNGLYTPDGRVIQGKETPLLLLVHFADMWASRFTEVEYKPVADGGLF